MTVGCREMLGYRIEAVDGPVGRVEDFFFDAERWTLRYLVDRTGGLLNGKELLIATHSFDGPPDRQRRVFPLSITREQARKSPDVDTDQPVSRQKELELLTYYSAPVYWQQFSSQTLPPVPLTPPLPESVFEELSRDQDEARTHTNPAAGDTHLYSFTGIRGYALQARDGRIGEVRDLLVEEEGWAVQALVADINGLLPNGIVEIERFRVRSFSWEDNQVSVDMTVDEVRRNVRIKQERF